MLIKLIKHDIISSGKTFLMMYAALIISSLVLLIARGSVFLSSIAMILYGLATFIIIPATFLIVFVRFSKTVFGHEGYLTNTLPVSPSTIVLSKLISSYIWFIATFTVIVLSSLLMASVGFESTGNVTEVPQEIYSLLTFIFFGSIIASSTGILFLFFCISFGQLAKSRRKLLAVITYFVISFFAQLLFIFRVYIYESVGILVFDIMSIQSSVFDSMIPFFTLEMTNLLISSIVLFFGTTFIIKHRLNLE